MGQELKEIKLIEKEEIVEKLKGFKNSDEVLNEIEALGTGFDIAVELIINDFDGERTREFIVISLLENLMTNLLNEENINE